MIRLKSDLDLNLNHWYVLFSRSICYTRYVYDIKRHNFFGRIYNDIIKKEFRLIACVKLNGRGKSDYVILNSYKLDTFLNEKQIRHFLLITKNSFLPTKLNKKKKRLKKEKKKLLKEN